MNSQDNKYKELFDKSADAMLIIENGKFVDCNEAAVKMLNYNNKNELLQTHPSELSPEYQEDGKGSFQKANEMMQIALEKGTHRFEWLHKKSDGEIFPVEVSLTVISKKANHKILHTVWHDITNIKKAETELKESKEKFKNLSLLKKAILESPVGIVVFALDINYRYIDFTPTHKQTMKAIWGVDIEIGKNMLEYLANNKDRKKAKVNFDKVLKGERFTLYEEYGHKELVRAFYENRYSPVFDENDKIIGLSVYVIDITERKNAERKIEDLLKEIQQSEAKYKTLFNESPFGVLYFDKDSVIIDCNDTFVKIFGTSKEALIGLDMIHKLKDRKIITAVKVSLKKGLAYYEGDYKSITADKTTSIRTILKGLRDKNGEIIAGMGLVEDVSEKKKSQSIIEDMLRDLEISSEELQNKNSELEGARYATLNLIEDLENEIQERKRIEADLKDSEAKHRLISNLTSDYIFQTQVFEDRNQDMVWVAGSFQKITGYTLEEYKSIGGWRATIHHDDLTIDEKAYEKISSNEKTTLELRTYHKDGSIVWVLTHGSPIWDEVNNRLIGIIGAVKDITEKKHNQLIQQIQYNIANAAVTANKIKDLISVVKEELGQIINTTELYIAFYNEATGMFMMDVYEDSKDKIETWKAEKSVSGYVMKEGKSVLLNKKEILKLAESGEIDIIGTLPELWLGVPLRIDGKNIGIIAAQSYNDPKSFDSSNVKALEIIANQLSMFVERKRAEEETIRLSRAIIQSPVSVIITNFDGTIEYINPKFTEITGYTLLEAMGQNPRILKSNEHSKEFYENLWDTILSGKNWKGEFHNKRKNGELYWENAIISPIVNDEGRITHFVAIKEDITEKKKMLEELITAKDKAEVSERLKTEFLAQMSHEIRSPLNVILNFVSLIKEEVGVNINEDLQFGFESIDTSSKRIIRTIDLILNMTDLQSGNYERSIRKFDAGKSLKALTAEYKHYAATKNIELKQNLDFISFKINSDEYAFTQIFGNLIDNAIKYTDKGYVEVKAQHSDNNLLTISISDTGIGISKEFLPKLFSTFTQEEQGYTRSYDGNGLGMALVKRYCDLINAEISVESKKGKGTTFTVVFPSKI